MREGYSIKKVKDICKKGSSNIAQKDLVGHDGVFPIYGASGVIKLVDFYQQEKECIGFVKDGSVGKLFILPPCSSVISTMQYIFPKDGYLLKYVAYCLQSLDVSRFKTGAVIPHIYFRDYGETDIIVPSSIEEQQRIVDSLDSSFSKIEALRANAEKRLQSIGALYQSVLKSSLSPQHGWVHETMGDRCKLSQGLAINSHTKHLLVKESSLPLLRIKDMKEGTRELFVNEKECPNSCRAYPDDLIYTRTGNTLGLIFTGMYGVLHNNCFKIEIDRERIDKAFYMYYVQQDEFRNRILSLAKRAAQPDITHKIFKEQPLIYPSLEIQRAIVGKIERVDSICKELQESCLRTIELCDDLKKALLKKVFSSEL